MPEELAGVTGVREADVSGKRVLLRTSLNVPLTQDGAVADEFRLKRGLETLAHLTKSGAKVIIVGYIGREGGTLAPVAEALQKLVPEVRLSFFDEPLDQAPARVAALQAGECLMVQNIRREAGEEKNDPALAKALADLADLYVDDAFAEAHRAYASNVAVAKLLPAYAGLLFETEVTRLAEALHPPQDSVAILGGAKFETKQPLIEKFVPLYRTLLIGGALANDLLKTRGLPVGASLISALPVPVAIAENEQVEMPVDLVVEGDGSRPAHIADVRAHERIVDIGQQTIAKWTHAIEQAPFVLWNGPMGVYEKGYTAGTDALARALETSRCRAVLGGGDTAAAIAKITLDPERVFLSTGGGAMLQFLADGTLPALEALKH